MFEVLTGKTVKKFEGYENLSKQTVHPIIVLFFFALKYFFGPLPSFSPLISTASFAACDNFQSSFDY